MLPNANVKYVHQWIRDMVQYSLIKAKKCKIGAQGTRKIFCKVIPQQTLKYTKFDSNISKAHLPKWSQEIHE